MAKSKAEAQTGPEDITPAPVVRAVKEPFTFDHDKRRAWCLNAEGQSVEVDYQNAFDAYRVVSDQDDDNKAATAAGVARVYPVA